MKFVLIPPGKFLMGMSDEGREDYVRNIPDFPRETCLGWVANESPQHEVWITRAFYLGACPVTQAQFEEVMGQSPSRFRAGGPEASRARGLDTSDFPVDSVTWHDAVAFCARLSELPEEKKAGRTYRLPTEAEWEYACRAGTTTAFHFGASLSSKQANFDGNYPYGGARKGRYLNRPSLVGSYPPNAFGLFDMHGNINEWVSDWYGARYYARSPRRDPKGPKKGTRRIIRGGSHSHRGANARSGTRIAWSGDSANRNIGFRVVLVRA
jgi:formylglycine-generating enzyme required for sulfatase activity